MPCANIYVLTPAVSLALCCFYIYDIAYSNLSFHGTLYFCSDIFNLLWLLDCALTDKDMIYCIQAPNQCGIFNVCIDNRLF